MSLNADFIYNDDWHDVSNRVVFNYFSELCPNREDECSIECQVTLEQLLELHKMLCDILYKDRGYASTKTQVIKKGRLFIYELLKSRDILPVCEQPC